MKQTHPDTLPRDHQAQGLWDRSQLSQELPVSSMKTSELTSGELRASWSQPLGLFSFPYSADTGIARWHHAPFTFHPGKQGAVRTLAARRRTCFIQSPARKETKLPSHVKTGSASSNESGCHCKVQRPCAKGPPLTPGPQLAHSKLSLLQSPPSPPLKRVCLG